jgi:hypothetical protein
MMKFRATYKFPDAVHYGIQDALEDMPDDDDRDNLEQELFDFAFDKVGSSEYITVEFDTEAGTVTVVPR